MLLPQPTVMFNKILKFNSNSIKTPKSELGRASLEKNRVISENNITILDFANYLRDEIVTKPVVEYSTLEEMFTSEDHDGESDEIETMFCLESFKYVDDLLYLSATTPEECEKYGAVCYKDDDLLLSVHARLWDSGDHNSAVLITHDMVKRWKGVTEERVIRAALQNTRKRIISFIDDLCFRIQEP